MLYCAEGVLENDEKEMGGSMTEIESKAEARKRNRRELLYNHGIKIGLRKPKSAKLSHSIEERKRAICMCCGKQAYKCICSGYMSEAAMNRFFEKQKEEK